MGRLTLRKLHLLLAEWRAAERQLDLRTYKLMCSWLSEAPEPGTVFPSLADIGSETEAEDADDTLIFEQVAGALQAR